MPLVQPSCTPACILPSVLAFPRLLPLLSLPTVPSPLPRLLPCLQLFLVGQPACLLAEAFFPGALVGGWAGPGRCLFASRVTDQACGAEPSWCCALPGVPGACPALLQALTPLPPFPPPPLQPTGTIDVAELVRVRSPLEEEYGPLQKPVHTCTLHAWSPAAAAPAGAAPLLLVACPRELAAEQAGAWARGVLAALAPARAALACTLPAMHYRGAGSPADDDLVFSLHTAAAQAARGGSRAAADLPPQLPAATMLGGLPAALLVECELGGLPAALVAGVQQQQVPDAAFLLALGCATQAALGSLGASPPAAEQQRRQQQGKHELLAALGAGADAVYRSSASSSIFS